MGTLDALFGLRSILVNGIPVTFRQTLNLLGDWGVTQGVDSDGKKTLEIAAPSGGGSGGGLSYQKAAVRAATVEALPASTRVGAVRTANANGALPLVDAVSMAVGESLLDKDDADGTKRGVYTVTSLGSVGTPWVLTRRADFDESGDVACMMSGGIAEGANYALKFWKLTSTDPIVMNTSALSFAIGDFVADTSTPQPESQASASAGPYSSANYFSATSSAMPLSASNTIYVLFEVTALGDQTICGDCATGNGWFLNFNGSGDFRLFFRGGANPNFVINTLRQGLHCVAITRLAGGAMRCSLDGATATQLSAAPAYVALDGTSIATIGRSNPAVGTSAGTGIRVLAVGHIAAELSDADLKSATDTVNVLDRYQVATLVKNHASLTSLLSFPDGDQVGATVVSGVGSSPITWTRNGAIVQNTIEPELYFALTDLQWHDNGEVVTLSAQASGPSYKLGSGFRRIKFNTAATKIVFDSICDWSGVPNMSDFGVSIAGVNQGNGVDFVSYSHFRRMDLLGLSSSVKDVVVTDGPRAITGGVATPTIRGITVRGIQVPKSTPITITSPTPVTHRLVKCGDSITDGQTPSTSSCYQAAGMLMRTDYPGSISMDVTGSYTWWHLCKDTAAINATVARWSAMCDGTSSNRIWINLGTNDYNFWNILWGTAANRSTFRTQLGALLDAMNVARPTVKIHLQTPLDRQNETTLIPPTTGVDLPMVRADITTVQSTRTGFCFIHDGTLALAAPPSSDFSDAVHLTSTGMANWKAWIKTRLAAASDSIGSGY